MLLGCSYGLRVDQHVSLISFFDASQLGLLIEVNDLPLDVYFLRGSTPTLGGVGVFLHVHNLDDGLSHCGIDPELARGRASLAKAEVWHRLGRTDNHWGGTFLLLLRRCLLFRALQGSLRRGASSRAST